MGHVVQGTRDAVAKEMLGCPWDMAQVSSGLTTPCEHLWVSENGGTPSHHPFRTMGFSSINHLFHGYPHGHGTPEEGYSYGDLFHRLGSPRGEPPTTGWQMPGLAPGGPLRGGELEVAGDASHQ